MRNKRISLVLGIFLSLATLMSIASCGSETDSPASSKANSRGSSEVSSVSEIGEESGDSSGEVSSADPDTSSANSQNATSSRKINTANSSRSTPTNPGANSQPTLDESVYPKSLKGKTVTRLLWYAPTPNEKQVYDNFTKVTGCKVKIVQTTYGNYLSKLSGMSSSGASPDSVFLHPRHFPMFMTRNYIQPIDQYVMKDDPVLDFKGMDILKWDNKYYGIANSETADTPVVFFNKSQFDNATNVNKNPLELYESGQWNWNTLADLTQKMQQKDNKGNITRYGLAVDTVNVFQLSAGVDFVSVKGTTIANTIKDPKLTEAWQFVKDLLWVKKYGIKAADALSTQFASGKSSMCINGSWGVNRTGPDSLLKKMKDKWDWVPFPAYPNGKSYQPTTQQIWCVPLKAKQPEAGYYLNRWGLDPASLNGIEGAKPASSYMDSKDIARMKKLHETDKFSMVSQGIIGDSDTWALWWDLQNPANQIPTIVNSWSPKIDAAIKQVVNEIPKK